MTSEERGGIAYMLEWMFACLSCLLLPFAQLYHCSSPVFLFLLEYCSSHYFFLLLLCPKPKRLLSARSQSYRDNQRKT